MRVLIRDAEVRGRCRDVRIEHGLVVQMGGSLARFRNERLIQADGGALLPGLHDHHLHLRATAAGRASVPCGPPEVASATALLAALHRASRTLPPGAWLRGTGYHESVAGTYDRDWMDREGPQRPLRIQHRGGRCWLINTAGLLALGLDPARGADDPFERQAGRATGRLYDADAWLRSRTAGTALSLRPVSEELARHGVTAVTDATPRNDLAEFRALAAAQARGELLQSVVLMGDESLDGVEEIAGPAGRNLSGGATKFHLHDADLTDFDGTVARIRRSHGMRRPAAFHCVTRGELAFAVGALSEAGAGVGDRIEHASVCPPDLLEEIVRLGLKVVAQPHFVGERGDAYLDTVAAEDRPWLYRLRGFAERGVALAGGTDAPFGRADPWASMRSAVERRTRAGQSLGPEEALSPEAALALFLPEPETGVRTGRIADLCLLDRPWAAARQRLDASDVRLTLKAGEVIWSRGPGD